MLRLVQKLGTFVGKRITLLQHLVEVEENKHQFVMEVAQVTDAVAILAINDKGNVLLVKNFRYPVGEEVLEIPAGKIEVGDVSPMERAKDELREEAGLEAADWAAMGEIMSSPGITTERIQLFRAQNLKSVPRDLELSEAGMKVIEFTIDEIYWHVKNHLFRDAKTRLVLTEYLLHLATDPNEDSVWLRGDE